MAIRAVAAATSPAAALTCPPQFPGTSPGSCTPSATGSTSISSPPPASPWRCGGDSSCPPAATGWRTTRTRRPTVPQFFGCGGGNSNGYYCNRRLDREMKAAELLELSNPAKASARWESIDRELTGAAVWVAYVNERAVDFVSKRGHAEQEPGEAESPDRQLVEGERRGEGHDHQRRVLGEERGVPADDDPRGRHDDWLMQQVEGQHGLVAVPGGAPPPRLGRRGRAGHPRWPAAAAGGDGPAANPMIATIHAQPARPCRALQPGATPALSRRPGPARQPPRPAAPRSPRSDGQGRPAGAPQRGLEPRVGGDQEPVQEREHIGQRVPSRRC